MPDIESEPHLLVVDDDQRIRDLLKKYLQQNGFVVTTARDAPHARKLLQTLTFDFLILDVMMPGEDGISFLRSFRENGDPSLPVLLLTAKGMSDERILGLEAGADDYLVKPYEPKELLLRINAVLRRIPKQSEDHFNVKSLSFGALRYDVEESVLWDDETPVRLTATESQLLRELAKRPNETMSRDALVQQLRRNGMQTQDRAIDVQITRLRRKLESNPKDPRYLQTVRGLGYMLVPDPFGALDKP